MKLWTNIELNNMLKEVIEQGKKVGIPISNIINENVKINKRAKSRLAACKCEGNILKHFTIEVGEALTLCNEQDLKGILVHEILHTCPGCMNHGKGWKHWVKVMCGKYGYKIKRTMNYEELGLENIGNHETKQKYIVECSECGMIYIRQRFGKLVQHPENYRCKCGGKLFLRGEN